MIIRFLPITQKTLRWVAGISIVLTLGLLAAGERETVLAWWVMLVCLLPALIWVQRSQFLSVKIFVWLACVTQAVTMPMFYLNPEGYAFQSYRPFGFTGLESLQVFFKLGVFLLVFLAVASLLEGVVKLPRVPASTVQQPPRARLSEANPGRDGLLRVSQKTSLISTSLILLVILLMIPLNQWMFQMGIGFTGVEPPKLPYRLSGILTHLAKLIVPALLAFLYLRTNRRSLFLVTVLGVYGIYLGLCTASRGAALSIVFAPIVFALLDRRRLLFSFGLLLALAGAGIVTTSREFAYMATAGVSTRANTSLSILGVFLESSARMEWNNLLLVLPSIIGRMVSFQGLFLASQVDPTMLGGCFAVWLKTLHWSLVDLGHEAVHLEVLGYMALKGFYNATSDSYAYVFWAVNGSTVYYLFFALSSALFLMLQEQAIRKTACRYGFPGLLAASMVFVLSVSFAITPGYPQFVYIFFALLLFSKMPKFRGLQAFFRFTGVSNQSPPPRASARMNPVLLSRTNPEATS